MGISTQAILTSAPSVIDLLHWADKEYRQANINSSRVDGDFFYLNFIDNGEQRNLAVFLNNHVSCDYDDLYTGDATFISMGCWGNSETIARKLVSQFGGWFKVNDFSDNWKRLDQF